MHLTSSPIDWYAARAGGVVAYLLLTTGVLLGLTMSTRRRSPLWPRIAVEDVHRFTGLLTATFIAAHVVTIAIDRYLPFSVTSIVVPFTSSYRPVWVGLGIVAAELLIALAVTNRLRNRAVSYRAWRRAHYLNFGVWAAATVHGMGSGTDRSASWMGAIYAVAIGSVVGFTAWRVARTRTARRLPGLALPAGIATVAAALAIVLVHGPLRFNPKPYNAATFQDDLQGQIVRQLGQTRGIVSLAGQGTGSQHVLLRADLLIAPQHLLSTSFQMEYLPSGARCRGSVTRVDDDGLGFAARCRMADGRARTVAARWDVSGAVAAQDGTATLSGTVTSTA